MTAPLPPTTRKLSRVLVANRGEIARRVFASCRRLGIETVAVFSDADADLPHVREADAAVRLAGNTPAETYLRADAVLHAAQQSGADAIHPGYGFLSENAAFARAVVAAGLTWIGPPPEAIESMGSKIGAKDLMRSAGVPVLDAPASPGEEDLPLLVKASAGGGGRGMRVVRSLAELEPEIARAAAEAQSAFGDGTVFVEPYVEAGRHVEVQIVGTLEGVLVFGDRDCSVQRRHQKVVEEAPAPGIPDWTRKALHEAARKAGEAIGYLGAGTVEFLFDPARDRFYFLEMNTRLQVEHPVTECVLGVDLVEAQLAVAEGRPVAEPGGLRGHAVEVRLYAEDPAAAYQPQSGTLHTLDVPHDVEFGALSGAGVRLDAGFESGSEVGTFYDAMLAKVIAWAPTREQAIRQLVGALRRARIHGVTTNRDQLVSILTDPGFADMTITTTWLEARPPEQGTTDVRWHAVAAALAEAALAGRERVVQRGVPVGWRNVTSQPQRTVLRHGDQESVVGWFGGRDGYRVDGASVVRASPESVSLEVDGVTRTYTIARAEGRSLAGGGTERVLDVDGGLAHAEFVVVPRFTDPAAQHASGSLLAPMPGSVVTVAAEVGQQVHAGDPVLVLEAMKMQHTVTAPHPGVVSELNVKPGQQVAAGEVLAVVEEIQ